MESLLWQTQRAKTSCLKESRDLVLLHALVLSCHEPQAPSPTITNFFRIAVVVITIGVEVKKPLSGERCQSTWRCLSTEKWNETDS